MNDPLFNRFQSLPEAIEPERDLWPEIATRLDRSPVTATTRVAWPVALAASVALVAMTAAITWRIASPAVDQVPPAQTLASLIQISSDSEYTPTPELLSTRTELIYSLQRNWSRLPAESQRIVADNLLEIRDSLTAIEAALSQDPDNASLQQLLHTTYEQELAMLVTLNRASHSLPIEVEL
ncbi:MAG: hypothetical protein HKN49_03430 [Gammaproteobacteria bacterium]|nr:hypothetical protein [Gammaproteobacteria bacterium]